MKTLKKGQAQQYQDITNIQSVSGEWRSLVVSKKDRKHILSALNIKKEKSMSKAEITVANLLILIRDFSDKRSEWAISENKAREFLKMEVEEMALKKLAKKLMKALKIKKVKDSLF